MKSQQKLKLSLGAIGVVFGDIGTSPIYALRECLAPGHGVELTSGPILGVVSLLVWTLIVVVCVKYLAVVLRADNKGEGGILALVSLLKSPWTLAVGIVGAALLYADGALTPAVSVLSALEGLNLISPTFQSWVVPLSVVVLVGLFAFQSRGTGRISALFGPVIVVWFVVLAGLGVAAIAAQPEILAALNPGVALGFATSNPFLAFSLLGYVFLAVTGTEALYADLGHFGKGPIRWGWYGLAFPALVLNYLGQGALVLADPTKTDNLFFQLAPSWALTPLIVLATLATVIASQAVITGAFSLARQSVQLGLWPRVAIRHTSADTIGQVYVPVINGALFLATVFLVLGFRESSKLADAYGIAVSGTMLLTTVLLSVAAHQLWKTPWWVLGPATAFFLLFDATFFAANATKLFAGGWVVLASALALVLLMTTWRTGRRMLRRRYEAKFVAIGPFLESLRTAEHPVHTVKRPAVYLAGSPEGVPPSLLHNLKHNHVLHQPLLLVTVETTEIPQVDEADRAQVTEWGQGVRQVRLAYGFSESPDVPLALANALRQDFDRNHVTYFLGKESLIPGRTPGMSLWRKRLYKFLAHNALDATTFYRLPAGQVVEIGGQTEL